MIAVVQPRDLEPGPDICLPATQRAARGRKDGAQEVALRIATRRHTCPRYAARPLRGVMVRPSSAEWPRGESPQQANDVDVPAGPVSGGETARRDAEAR
jgi:hypothetical protein